MKGGITVSNLLAVNCGNTQMFQVRDTYPMSMIEQAMDEKRSIDVIVYMLEFNENRMITIRNLRRDKDGWGVEHIEGIVLEVDGIVRAILYDNPMEAHPLNLK